MKLTVQTSIPSDEIRGPLLPIRKFLDAIRQFLQERCRFFSILILLFLAQSGCMLRLVAQSQALSQMVHTSWSGRDGAPQAVEAIAQTPDGSLWLATLNGLFSFDGLTFSPFHSAPNSPSLRAKAFHFLFVSRQGDLWAFGFHGAPVRVHEGTVKEYGRSAPSPIDVMGYPQQDSSRSMWAIENERELVTLGSDGVWHGVPDPARSQGHITMLFIDSLDNIWLIVDDQLYRRAAHETQFRPTGVHMYGTESIGEGVNHDLWLAGSGLGTAKFPSLPLQHIDNLGRSSFPPLKETKKLKGLLTAADGSLWALTVDDLLVHLSARNAERHSVAARDRISLGVGATNVGDHSFIMGSDGSVWAGGTGGLEHFAAATLVPALVPSRVGTWASCIDSKGRLWASGPNGKLYRARGDQLLEMAHWSGVEFLFCSSRGQVALRDASGIAVLKGDDFERLPLLPGFPGYGNHYIFTGITQTMDGKIIAAAAGGAIGRSLWVYSARHWKTFLPVHDMPEVTAMQQYKNGALFIGFRGDNIGLYEDGALRLLPTGRPGIRATISFATTSHGMLVCGLEGIAIRDGNKFRMLPFANPDHATAVTGLAEDEGGNVWINGAVGVVRIAASEINEAIKNPVHQIISMNIHEGDFVGPAAAALFSHSVVLSPRGLMWFATLNGIVSVNPENFHPSTPPQLTIQSIRADGESMAVDHTFPPGIETLRIEYAGIDLRNARGVNYRYRLDGFDKEWREVGPWKEANYAHLRPGQYTFQVMAKNGYGIWTAPVLSSPFVILPRFYQTPWFELLGLALFVALLWFGLRARVAFVTAVVRARAEERADERISIARDIHDTLLQGVQGLLMTFHSAAEQVPCDHESKQALERALSIADRVILEGRDRVKGLRSFNVTDKDLQTSLDGLGIELDASGWVQYAVRCTRQIGTLRPAVATEVFFIAREAIINAFRHAQPTQVVVNLEYTKQSFNLSVIDDGHGLDAYAVGKSEARGHWGIRGMSERSDKLGGSFSCDSSPGQGTSIRFTLKAKRAYE